MSDLYQIEYSEHRWSDRKPMPATGSPISMLIEAGVLVPAEGLIDPTQVNRQIAATKLRTILERFGIELTNDGPVDIIAAITDAMFDAALGGNE